MAHRTKEIHNAYSREWDRKNPESKKAIQKRYADKHPDKMKEKMWRKNKIKAIDGSRFLFVHFQKMLLEQDGKCKICKIELVLDGVSLNKACVDHDHKTGLVRRILCDRCN